MDQLIPGADRDIVAPLAKRIGGLYEKILLKTKVTAVEAKADGIHVAFEGEGGKGADVFDAVLVSVGRRPNGGAIGAEAAGVKVDERGFIAVDKQQRTNVSHIFAIGDVVGQPMLAHKATHEGKVAAEVASGYKSAFDAKCIPSVAYTDPEVAWVGVTETEAQAKGFALMVGCMISTSLAIAPAMLVAPRARVIDLDGPLLLAQDRPHGMRFAGSILHPAAAQLWG